MRRLFFIHILLLVLVSQMQTEAQDLLQTGFKSPPPAAKARTWWHWINGNVSKTGITADLEAMKRVGIQEAQIFNVDQGYPDGQATFLSAEWLELFRFAVAEANRLGLEIGFHNGAGWSSSGGPWVKPENAMQTVVFSEVRVKGSRMITQTLPQPEAKLGYYRDIAVVAFPAPQSNQRIDELELKTLSGNAFKTHLAPDDKAVDPLAVIRKASIVDLSPLMSAGGILKWKVPAGEWIILRIGHAANGAENRPAGQGGRGLEVDKMSRKSLDAYWEGGIKPVLEKLGPLVGASLTNCLIDSYEVGCNNWTPGFEEAFKRRRHYDCMEYLPALAGYYIESGEITERFLWDFRKTVGDLIAENYYGYFGELCHKNGMKFSVEPYGGPFESLKAGAFGDIVMGEFWLGSNVYLESTKLAASIAHLQGNTIVGAESFTSFGSWRNHPATMKSIGDYVWSEGVNRLIFHTYVHQPWNIAPGLTFHMYGVEMSRLNTWWEQSRAYMDYVGRSQFLLQQGRSTADVLVFTGESSPNDAMIMPEIKTLGYDYDQIGPDQLMDLTVRNGKIYTAGGLSYRLLLLPETRWATPELLAKLRELVFAGAVVSGTRPARSPSLDRYPACDDEVAKLGDEIWNSGKVLVRTPADALFKKMALVPDFQGGTADAGLTFIHRASGADDIYFVANPQNEKREEICRFRVTGKKPELWNAETGQIMEVPVWRDGPGNTTEIPISLEANGAVFVVFRSSGALASARLISAKSWLDDRPLKPLPELKVNKAEYGTFLPDGIADVTIALAERMSKRSDYISADNGLSPSDPAPGSVKELRLEYEMNGERQELHLLENRQQHIEQSGKEFRLIRALYGKFPLELKGMPPSYPIFDVTARVNDLLEANRPVFMVNDSTLVVSPAGHGEQRELRLVYSAEGETRRATIKKGRAAHLETDMPEPRLVSVNGVTEWMTPYSGKLQYTLASGVTQTAVVRTVPQAIELSGPWALSFPVGSGAPLKTVFPQLVSWPKAVDDGIKYFSGTAIYQKQFTLEPKLLKKGNSLELDLGSVHVIAEVIVNGKNLGILWKAPFRVALGDAVHAGTNSLEIRVTNLWPNRLIGDARLPREGEGETGIPSAWPSWLERPESRASRRSTFTTWKHWDENSPLQPSGLLGPVVIRSYQHVGL